MLIVWYCLISFVYFLLNIIEFFFVELLKFDKSFFNLFFNSIYKSINIKEFKNPNFKDLDYRNNNLNFKLLYQEYLFFNSVSKCETIKLFLINSIFSKMILKGFYNPKFLFLIYITNSKNFSYNIKKINTEKIYSNLQIGNFKKKFNPSSLYLFYKVTYKSLNNKFVTINQTLENNIQKLWNIKYAPSNFTKYISLENLNQYNVLYLRKHKVFNKGRYSRNRQYYRTGVYWCLYVNIIAVIGIYFWFYRFTMNFGYLWWLLCGFILSFIIPKTVKYGLYNPIKLLDSLSCDIIWISSLIINFYNGLIQFFSKFLMINSLKNTFLASLFTIINSLKFNNKIYIWEFNTIEYYSISQSDKINLFSKFRANLMSFFKLS